MSVSCVLCAAEVAVYSTPVFKGGGGTDKWGRKLECWPWLASWPAQLEDSGPVGVLPCWTLGRATHAAWPGRSCSAVCIWQSSCWCTAPMSLGMTLIRVNTLAFRLIGKDGSHRIKKNCFGSMNLVFGSEVVLLGFWEYIVSPAYGYIELALVKCSNDGGPGPRHNMKGDPGSSIFSMLVVYYLYLLTSSQNLVTGGLVGTPSPPSNQPGLPPSPLG
jgi:hypothetical protein